MLGKDAIHQLTRPRPLEWWVAGIVGSLGLGMALNLGLRPWVGEMVAADAASVSFTAVWVFLFLGRLTRRTWARDTLAAVGVAALLLLLIKRRG